MNNSVQKIPSNFSVKFNLSSEKTLDNETKTSIEEYWKKELVRTQAKIFNGQILSLDSFDGITLYGHFAEYKHYIAQTYNKALFNILKIKPICVCAYTTTKDALLFGKRSSFVTDYKSYYELVPAGGINRSFIKNDVVNTLGQIKLELLEEANIAESYIEIIEPRYLILDETTLSFDICFYIELKDSVQELMLIENAEYTHLQWIELKDIDNFVEKNREMIIPTSLKLLELFNKSIE